MLNTWRDPIRRTALILAAAFVAIAACSVAFYAQPGLWAGERFLRRASETQYGTEENYRIGVERRDGGADFRFMLGGAPRAARMTVAPRVETDDWIQNERVEIEFDDGVTWRGEARGGTLLDEEGFPAFFGMYDLDGGEYFPFVEEGISVADVLYRVYKGYVQTRGHWWVVFLAAPIFALGVAVWLFPQKMAFFGARWRFASEPELSDSGLFFERLSAVVMMVVAVGMLAIGTV